MNPVEILRNHIRRNYPGAELELTRPLHKDGMWSLDVDLEDAHLAIQWSASTGFGLSTAATENFGEGPDETYESPEALRDRIDRLLTSIERTAPSFGVLLSRLREQRGITQQLLAERLGITQSTLSGVERRDDVQVSTVRRIIGALGGAFELFAVFRDVQYRINIPAVGSSHGIRYSVVQIGRAAPETEVGEEAFEALRHAGGLRRADELAANISARGSVLEMV